MTFDKEVEERIDRICIEFEDELRSGHVVALEDYIVKAPSAHLERAFSELLLLELDYTKPKPSVNDLIARFPQFENAIRDRLESPEDPDRRTYDTGDQIGRYVIQERIGQGSFGKVYKAFDEMLQRHVALKAPQLPSVQPDCEGGIDRAIDRFFHEAISLANLTHPNVVSIHDVVRDKDGYPLLVLEYIEEATSLDVTESPSVLLRHLISVTDAMDYVHRQGFVHRDLKPENILIDSKGNAVVTDFGLSATFDQGRRQRGESAGTLKYMSPELVRGHSHRVDARSDIWSIGVILYEALAGKPPFDADDEETLVEAILSDAATPFRQTDDQASRRLEEICLKCLRKSPEDRYYTARDLAKDLRAQLSPDDSGKFSRRSLLRIGVPCVLAATGAVAVQSFMRNEQPVPTRLPAVVEITVYRNDEEMSLAAAQPLRDDDALAYSIQTMHPARIWVYWIEPEGTVDQLYPVENAVGHSAEFEVYVPPDSALTEMRTGTATLVILGTAPDKDLDFKIDDALKGWRPQFSPIQRPLRFDFGEPNVFVGRGLKHAPVRSNQVDPVVLDNQRRFHNSPFKSCRICRSICIPITGITE